MRTPLLLPFLLPFLLLSGSCGDDDGTAADRLGVGAQCTTTDECEQDPVAEECLPQFKGGYCGIEACVHDTDCPASSACVAHEDGVNYCFRTCIDKPECNLHRDLENEANCSSSAVFVDGTMGRKACVPPSAGI